VKYYSARNEEKLHFFTFFYAIFLTASLFQLWKQRIKVEAWLCFNLDLSTKKIGKQAPSFIPFPHFCRKKGL